MDNSGDRLTGPVDLEGGHLRLTGPLGRVRAYPTTSFAVVAGLGLLALASVTFASGMACAGRTCSSAPWWVAVVLAAAVTVFGLVGWARRPPADRAAGWQPSPLSLEILVAAAAVMILVPVLSRAQHQLLDRTGVAFTGAALLSALVAWWVAAALHGRLAGGRRGHEAVVGTVAALAAGTAWGSITHASGMLSSLSNLPVLWSVALAATVLAVRGAKGHRSIAGAVAAGAGGLALVSVASTAAYLAPYLLPPEPAPVAEVKVPTVPEPTTSTPTQPEPEQAAPPPAPAPGGLCNAATLVSHPGTPVPGGHDVATTITVTNWSDEPCQMEGWPSLRLLSDGEDLALYVHVANVDPSRGTHVEAEPFMLEPKEAAKTQVWWKAHGAAADMEAAQELHIGVGGSEVALPLAQHDNWDVVRSAEAWVAPWQPAGPDPEGDGPDLDAAAPGTDTSGGR